jgi:hypothetical protein
MAAEHPILPQHPEHPHTGGARRGFIYFNTTDDRIYYDNGWMWADIGDPFSWQTKKFDFTAAQVLTWSNANGPDFLPAVAGYVYVPRMAILLKRAGPVFTGTQATQIKYRNTAITPAVNIAITSVFDQTTEEAALGQAITALHATDADAASIGGKALMMSTNGGAAYGGTGSDCALLLQYRLLPVTAALLDTFPLTALP